MLRTETKNILEHKSGNNKPELLVIKGKEQDVAKNAIKFLKDGGANIFLYGTQLVRIMRFEQQGGPLTKLEPVTPPWLLYKIQDYANVVRHDARTRKKVKTSVPDLIIQIILNVPDLGDWPKLKSFVKTPLLLPDGTWISSPGFHETAWGGFYLDVDSDGGWLEPGQTKKEAEDALAELQNHFRFFPWDSDLSRSVALSALLTAVMRPVLDTAPMHVMDSPVGGTGKSLFINAVSIIITGSDAVPIRYSHRNIENRKMLDALLLAGYNMIAIDNISRSLQGKAINQILTEQVHEVHILRKNKIVSLPCTPFIMTAGNNIVIRGALKHHSVICRIDAQEEEPYLRNFPQDLLAETRQKRKEIVYWLQTIMRAHTTTCKQDRNECQFNIYYQGPFESWTLVRRVLIWLGLPDPVKARGDQY